MAERFFQKTEVDSVGRPENLYLCFDAEEADTDYSAARSIDDNTVVEQTENDYDEASNVIQATQRLRFHNATGLGALSNPGGSEPKARVYFLAFYPDALGRAQARANYGTNDRAPFNRPSTIPTASDAILVSEMEYNDRGELHLTSDPMGVQAKAEFDDLGRRTQSIENFISGQTGSDKNKTTDFTYTADGQIKTLTAHNSATGNQVTTWVYGVTEGNSKINSNSLLRAREFPDKSSGSDRIEYDYNQLGQPIKVRDQIGVVHEFDYDKLARIMHDRVTALAGDIDGAVRRISRAYDDRGLLESLTSYDNQTAGSGSAVNAIEMQYNGFGQMTREFQSHAGLVDPNATPSVDYGYVGGADNAIRRESITYPDATRLLYDYGEADLEDDMLGRVRKLRSGTSMQANYRYLGMGQPVICGYWCEPSVELTYYTPGGGGSTGDQYTGLDRFGRVVQQRWRKTSDDTDRVLIDYGYDRASNRKWRENEVASTGHDEYHVYDGLYRISSLERGNLNTAKTGIDGTPGWQENWTHDAQGNWHQSQEDPAYLTQTSGAVNLDQNRDHNKANEIDDITESAETSWPTPGHDAAGNAVGVPQPLSLGQAYDLTWDAWNRLVEIRTTSGDQFVARYAYDGLNRRATKLTGKEFRHFYYSDSWQVLEERLNDTRNSDKRYFWGIQHVDDLVCREEGNERHYALNDRWSVRAIVDVAGVVKERYSYDGFGGVRFMNSSFGAKSSSEYAWETLFSGYRYDQDTGLYQVRNRYLHTALGRWLSRDPVGYDAGTNLYSYAGNNPINRVDPMGTQEDEEIVKEEITDPLDAFWDANPDIQYFYMVTPALFKFRKGMTREDAINDINDLFGEGVWEDFFKDYNKTEGEDSQGNGKDENEAGSVGFWEGFIPIWGPGRQAYYDFQVGSYWWGSFNTALAASDIIPVRWFIGAARKGLWKAGSHTWGATSKWLSNQGWREFKGQHMHHWLIPQNTWGRNIPEWFKNQPWNLMPMPNRMFHNAIEGKGPDPYNFIGRLWQGSPNWFKFGAISGFGREANWYFNDWDQNQIYYRALSLPPDSNSFGESFSSRGALSPVLPNFP